MDMMLGKAFLELGTRNQNLVKGLNDAKGHTQSWGGGMMGWISKIHVAVAALGGLFAAGGFLGWGIKLAADAESAQISFEVLLGSASKAKEVLAELRDFAATTPFEMPELKEAALMLLNSGTATSELTEKLRMLGDMAAGSGKPINDLVAIYMKAQSTGRVTMEEINRLAERGIPIYEYLSEAVGKQKSELMDYVSKGKVGFEDLDRALVQMTGETGNYFNATLRQSKSLHGLWSTFKDQIGLIMQRIGEAIVEGFDLTQVLENVIAFAESFEKSLDWVMPMFSDWAGVVSDTLQPAMVALEDLLEDLGLTGQETTSGLGAGFDFVREAVMKVAEAMDWMDMKMAKMSAAYNRWFLSVVEGIDQIGEAIVEGVGGAERGQGDHPWVAHWKQMVKEADEFILKLEKEPRTDKLKKYFEDLRKKIEEEREKADAAVAEKPEEEKEKGKGKEDKEKEEKISFRSLEETWKDTQQKLFASFSKDKDAKIQINELQNANKQLAKTNSHLGKIAANTASPKAAVVGAG